MTLRPIKKIIHLLTVAAFFLQTLAPFSPSFAMRGEGLEFEENGDQGNTLRSRLSSTENVVESDGAGKKSPPSSSLFGTFKGFVGSALNAITEGVSSALKNPGKTIAKLCVLQVLFKQTTPVAASFGDEFPINQAVAGSTPSVSTFFNSGNALIAWKTIYPDSIYGRLYYPNGTALTNEFRINQNTTGNENNPSVATFLNGNAIIVWASTRTGDSAIWGRIYFPNGTPLTGEFQINQATTGTSPSVATFSNGNALIAWSTTSYGIYGRSYFPNGMALTDEFQIATVSSASSVATFSNGSALVAWSNPYVYGRFYYPNGTALTDEFQISQVTTAYPNFPPSVAIAIFPNGNALITWHTLPGDIYGRFYNSMGRPLTGELRINQAAAGAPLSVAAFPNDKALIAWAASSPYNIYGRLYHSNGTALTDEFQINQATTGSITTLPVATFSNGNALIAWDTASGYIYGRFLIPAFFGLNTTNPPPSVSPTVTPSMSPVISPSETPTDFQKTPTASAPTSYNIPFIAGVSAVGGALFTAIPVAIFCLLKKFKEQEVRSSGDNEVRLKETQNTPLPSLSPASRTQMGANSDQYADSWEVGTNDYGGAKEVGANDNNYGSDRLPEANKPYGSSREVVQ